MNRESKRPLCFNCNFIYYVYMPKTATEKKYSECLSLIYNAHKHSIFLKYFWIKLK